MKNKTVHIKDIVGKVVEKIEKQTNENEIIKERWQEIVGADTAKFTRPENIKKGCLWIKAESSLHLFELQIQKEAILNKIRSFFPEVEKIKFRIG